jgi:hypothetical protein
MNYPVSSYESNRTNTIGKADRVMQTEQFIQVLDAILAGKYSWACVLILRFAGYNPLHYIPYRTYNRIVKDNTRKDTKKSQNFSDSHASLHTSAPQQHPNSVKDLGYLEQIQEDSQQVYGGRFMIWLQQL